MQMQMQQIDSEKTVAETEETKAKTVARLVDAAYKKDGAAAPTLSKMKWDAMMKQQKMQMDENVHLQKLIHTQEMNDLQTEAVKKAANAKA